VIHVTHVIDGLEVGGAEKMLASLLAGTDRKEFRSEVISLSDIGPVGADIVELGIPVRALGLRPRLADAPRASRLVWWLRRQRPDVVQTWLYESDLLGGIASRMANVSTPVVWNIQQGDLDPARSKRRRIWAARACAALSRRVPTRVVCCSQVSAKIHQGLGYDGSRMSVIPNAVDVERFVPDESFRVPVRRELGVGDDTPLVGVMARFDPQKDHHGFVAAAGLLRQSHPDVHFVLCGKGVTRENRALVDWIERQGLAERFHLLGLRHDIARLGASLDLVVSSSAYGEAFPVALIEAMACGVPCVATDVGDSSVLVADTGVVVPPDDPVALAGAMARLLAMRADDRRSLGRSARERVKANYSLPTVVDCYQDLYRALCERRAHSG
jgi:glycosyltransferase involved in cell wall biosynthesis